MRCDVCKTSLSDTDKQNTARKQDNIAEKVQTPTTYTDCGVCENLFKTTNTTYEASKSHREGKFRKMLQVYDLRRKKIPQTIIPLFFFQKNDTQQM